MKQVKPYLADISFLQSVIDGYRIGIFSDIGLPTRVLNALDSLAEYGNVRILEEVPDFPEPKPKKKYSRKLPHWKQKPKPQTTNETKESDDG